MTERKEEKFNELLNSHILLIQKDKYFFTDDYNEFLVWRQAKILKEIQKATAKVENHLIVNSAGASDSVETEEDEEPVAPEVNIKHWEKRAHPEAMVDTFVESIKSL